jgi:hypothetical protein
VRLDLAHGSRRNCRTELGNIGGRLSEMMLEPIQVGAEQNPATQEQSSYQANIT